MKRINAVVLDWAGTTVDFGSFAPTQIFIEAFHGVFDIDITLAEARIPMGLGKWQHIEALGKLPTIDARWQHRFGRSMTTDDINAIYEAFMPLQIAKVVDFAAPIEGVVDTVSILRASGIKIGSCSGYPRAVMEKLVPAAEKLGYRPDYWIASDDLVAGGRPGPWMALQNIIELGIDSVAHCIKVDDAAPGIEEGRNAGMWSVGLALSGNEFGKTWDEYQRMSADDVAHLRQQAANKLFAAGAHYVIDTLANLPDLIEKINVRLANGERP
ncbi:MULTISPECIES: phosphonoacetaldehyde hydrolase [Providencia]|uniref:Phosphonoacetaldehyde hydrolase n=1 Tax=Providencia stuartii TaxID=588 RepID=A0ABD5L1Q4_PROST|nr:MULTISPECIES: phosphonoacetaldehyde hydrolase [Providencia]ELR5043480.1 phosphonoacetaldehyde hydrolase [Providencia rettgeri]ELR5121429.1 phosphonoacetaldehyde hydrolase [Providencia stuartii]ELR5291640.1 phosphonoacetaldehyde hydrolase [Providencia stuartii]MCR4180716.1 phosphonoacetaldehyde hydrolase [Providencia vermicola]URE78294.1 phosphonoacetaldehyde hydrolase [Providencia stuartii]